MKTIARNAEYVIKVVSKPEKALDENTGYLYAVFTREEAKYGSLAYPELQADSFEECLEWISSSIDRKFKFQVSPEYKERLKSWLSDPQRRSC